MNSLTDLLQISTTAPAALNTISAAQRTMVPAVYSASHRTENSSQTPHAAEKIIRIGKDGAAASAKAKFRRAFLLFCFHPTFFRKGSVKPFFKKNKKQQAKPFRLPKIPGRRSFCHKQNAERIRSAMR